MTPDGEREFVERMRGLGISEGAIAYALSPGEEAARAVEIENLLREQEARDEREGKLIDLEAAERAPAPSVRKPLPTLRELLAAPHALDPPAAVVPRLAWRGRTSLGSAKWKDGKSTLAGAAASAVVNGAAFLDGTAERGPVLIYGLEEHPGDLVRRLHRFGAAADDAAEVSIAVNLEGDLLDDLAERAATLGPALVVVDSLAAAARPRELESGNATGWTALVQGACDLAREFNFALLLLHHQKKGSAEFRDSGAIGASVDVIFEMHSGARRMRDNERLLTFKGRFGCGAFVVALDGDRFALRDDGTDPDRVPTTTEIVERFVAANPGATTNEIIAGCRLRKTETRAALDALVAADRLSIRAGANRSRRHYLPDDETRSAFDPEEAPT